MIAALNSEFAHARLQRRAFQTKSRRSAIHAGKNAVRRIERCDDRIAFDLIKTEEGWKIAGGTYTVESKCEPSPLGPLKQ